MEPFHARQLVIGAMFLVAIGAHVFVAWWLLRAFPFLGRHRRAFLAGATLLFLMAPIGRLFGAFYWKGLASVFAAAGTTEWMIVLLAAVPIAFTAVLARGTAALLPRSERRPTTRDDAPPISRRGAVERIAGLAALGTSATVLGWGSLVGRHEFRVEEVVVRLPGLPKALDGYTIAQISDLHTGLFVGDREISEGFAKVRSLRSDLVVVTGDLLDFDAHYAPWVARRLSDLRGRDGIVAVLGNHDYYAGFKLVLQAMRDAGVEVLVNEGRMIRPGDGGGFALLGVDDLWAARSGGAGPDLAQAIASVRPDAARVLLAHQPNFLPFARGKVGLQLSGHTHGGQINPGFCPADWLMRYVAGRYEDSGTTMWVNRGFGVAGPPSRVGSPPEVTKVVLVSA